MLNLKAGFDYDHFISLSRKFVLEPGLFAGGAIWEDNGPPTQHIFGVGGLSSRNYIDQYVDFTGLRFIQQFGYYCAIVRLRLQYNVYKNLYLTAGGDVGCQMSDVRCLTSIPDIRIPLPLHLA